MKKKNLLLAVSLSTSFAFATNVSPVFAAPDYTPGVTVRENTDHSQWDADYIATFVYEDSDARDAVAVNVQGGFQFYDPAEVEADEYVGGEDNSDIEMFDAQGYVDGMFPSSTNTQGGGLIEYDMTEIAEDVFEVSIPVPANQYFYAYYVTYDGETDSIQVLDPANLPIANGDSDSGWSLFYAGNGETEGQEYIYPRSNMQGSVSYVEYTASDDTTQPLGVYLPYGYDSNKTYKTIYVSHGFGGNEVEWFNIGSANNIMDNLIADHEVASTIVVTMDNMHFGGDGAASAQNIVENIIPFMEANYSVSTDPEDRAMAGLSMGSIVTNTVARDYPEEFGYFGGFSGGTTDNDITHYDGEALSQTTYYLTAGCVDFAYNGVNPMSSETYMAMLDDLGVYYDFDLKPGGHDWFTWRDSFTTFVKDYLWDYEEAMPATPEGVTVTENTNHPEWDADYLATFVYHDMDSRDAVAVNVTGGFQFFKWDEVGSYVAFEDNSDIPTYSAYEFEEGMFPSSSNTETGSLIPYSMIEVSEEYFEVTIPVPANQWFYAFNVEYGDGSTVDQVKDPANMPVANGDSDSGWSLFYSGQGETAGQEYIYPSTQMQGTVSYFDYEAVDGTTQPLGVYLPYGYDSTKTYKTIYVSHGGGGNEVEWFNIGSAANIMDNLIADNEVAQAVVVTMDNQYFGWDSALTLPNVIDHIIPYVEANYSVSTDAADRAFCGLSMGSQTTNEMMKTYPEEFGYFGSFSGGNPDLVPTHYDADALNESVLYLTAGPVDIAYNNTSGRSVLDYRALLDDLGVGYDFDLKPGGHDWFVWRDSLTTFVKDYLWDSEEMMEPVEAETTTTTEDTIVDTGDSVNVALYGAGLIVAGAALAYLNKKNKRFN